MRQLVLIEKTEIIIELDLMRTLFKLLLESFLGVHGHFLALLGFAIGFVCWFVLPNERITISSKYLLVVLLVFLICFFTLISFVKVVMAQFDKKIEEIAGLKKRLLPKVIDIYIDHTDAVFILLEPSDVFSFEAGVGLYCLRGVYEICFGCGVVYNVQSNKYIMIKILSINPGYESTLVELKQRNVSIYNTIVVKPHYPAPSI